MATTHKGTHISHAFDATTQARGLALQNRIVSAQVFSDVADVFQIESRVLPSSADGSTKQDRSYQQSTWVTEARGQLYVDGVCTCPIGFNCKHVYAVVLRFAQEHQQSPFRSGRKGAAHRFTLDNAPLTAAPVATLAVPAQPAPPPVPRVELRYETQNWLERLRLTANSVEQALAGDGGGAKPTNRVNVYVLDRQADGKVLPQGSITCVTLKVAKDGSLSEDKPYRPEGALKAPSQRAKHLTRQDVQFLTDLYWLQRTDNTTWHDYTTLGPSSASGAALDELLASGRLRYRTVDGPVLSAGPARAGAVAWTARPDGTQSPVLRPDPAASGAPTSTETGAFDVVLPMAPARYVDLRTGHVGIIETALPAALLAELLKAPPITPLETAMVSAALTEIATKPRGKASEPPKTPAASKRATAPAANFGEAAAAHVAPVTFAVPVPEAPENVEVRIVAPRPRVLLTTVRASIDHYQRMQMRGGNTVSGDVTLPVARLDYDYDGVAIAEGQKLQPIQRIEGGKAIVTPRDAQAEARAVDQLSGHGLRPLQTLPVKVPPAHARDRLINGPDSYQTYDLLHRLSDTNALIAFSTTVVPKLMDSGFEVLFASDYPYQLADGPVEWWADVGESSGIDWFSFELGITFDGHRISLAPHLAEIIGRVPVNVLAMASDPASADAFQTAMAGITVFHQLADGRLLPLAGDRLAPIVKSLLELIGPRLKDAASLKGGIKLHRAELGALAGFAEGLGSTVAWAASAEKLISFGRDLLRGRTSAAIAPPKGFKADLRPYQRDGLNWLEFLRKSGFGGVLADDMGLGKTVQALAFILREKQQKRLDKPVLILSPTSVLANWQAEAARFAPSLKVLGLRGADRQARFAEIPKHDVVLTTYPLLMRDHEVLLAQEFHAAILDEAQAIKNPKASISEMAHRINARHRFALTGTPLENNLGEVWSLFEFLSPGLLGDESTFRRVFRTPIEKHGDATAQSFLTRRLKPFMLRRTKAEVATELPPKTEIIERVQLEGPQRDLYEVVRSLMHDKVREEISKKGLARSHIIFLDALLKLRQICCDPRLLKMPQAKKVRKSAKLSRLMEMLPEMVAEGRRILLFSQFTSMLDLIEDELVDHSIRFVKLTGSTEDRATPVKRFQAGEVPVFLLSLKAGGTGLNLTAADTVIHYDPWWNPAVENQATDRAYRIGQDKPVFVHKLIVEEGIEEAIELLKQKKAALADALFAGTSKTGLDLTEADIAALFAPLGGGSITEPRRAKQAA